jgi:MerR family transcriptional regulator, light-induced transcriptional regulator
VSRASPTPAATAEQRLGALAKTFADHVLAGSPDAATEVAIEALELLEGNVARLCDDVLRAAAVRVGDLWHSGAVSVADEHLATMTLRRVMAAAKAACRRAAPRNELILLACPPGEAHDLGLNMLGDVLDLSGYDVRVLGADTPARDMAEYAVRQRAALVALSCATPISLGGLIASVNAMRDADPRVPVIVGGRCLHDFPNVLGEPTASAVTLTVAAGVDAVRGILVSEPSTAPADPNVTGPRRVTAAPPKAGERDS